MSREVGILGLGYSTPSSVITNTELKDKYNLSPEYIEMVFGVKERHIAKCGDEEPLSVLASQSAERALENAGISAKDIDLVVVSCGTSDYFLPKVGCYLQNKLKMPHAHVININAACSGPNFGLGIAWRYIKNEIYNNALVIMGDILSYGLEEGNVLISAFGDATSAAVLAPLKEGFKGILSDSYGSDGKYYGAMFAKAPGSACHLNEDSFNKGEHLAGYTDQATRDIMPLTVQWFRETLDACLNKASLTLDDINFFSPHPVSKVQIDAQLSTVNANEQQFHIVTDKLGHSGSGTSLIVLEEACKSGKITPGSNVYMFSVGAGFVWGGMIFKWCSPEMFIK